MRHGKKFNHLGRKKAHREAMLMNMANSLVEHKRIFTTVAKAKALKKYIEPLVTKAKNDTMHSRRTVFSYLRNKYAVKELFGEVANKVADRPGGYTRILKTENRLGDNAEMCMIELVDFNESMLEAKLTTGKSSSSASGGKKRTRRGKTGAKKLEAKVVETELGETKEKELKQNEESESPQVEGKEEQTNQAETTSSKDALNREQTEDNSPSTEVEDTDK